MTLSSAFNYNDKLEQFYTCLLKGSLEREDVANLEAETVQSSHELQQTFRNRQDSLQRFMVVPFDL